MAESVAGSDPQKSTFLEIARPERFELRPPGSKLSGRKLWEILSFVNR